jgi:hypothetical protein
MGRTGPEVAAEGRTAQAAVEVEENGVYLRLFVPVNKVSAPLQNLSASNISSTRSSNISREQLAPQQSVGSGGQCGAMQHRSQGDRAGLSALGSMRGSVRLGQAVQQQPQQHPFACKQRAQLAPALQPRETSELVGRHGLAEAGGFLAFFFPPNRISH